MNRLALFSRSLSILWRHKSLWLFGFLAALGGGGLNSLVSLTNFNSLQSVANMPLGVSSESVRTWLGLSFAQMIIPGLVLAVISFFIHTYAEGALIGMVNSVEAGETLSIGAGASLGLRRFVPLAATKALLALPVFILGALATGSFLSVFFGVFDRNQMPSLAFNFGAMFGLIMMINIINVLTLGISVSAKRAIVLEEISIKAAILRGWHLMRARSNDYFVIAILLILLGYLFNALIFAAVAPTWLSSGDVFSTMAVVSIALNLLVGTFTSMFISSIWTLAYRKWQGTSNNTLLKPATIAWE